MFERFTDRARRVLVIAQNDARDLGHAGIQPAHIFLALLEEGTGVAARAMTSTGADPVALRALVADAHEVTAGRRNAERLPFSPKAKKVLELSLREALQMGHGYIGTEHLLLAVLRWATAENPRSDDVFGLPVKRLREATLVTMRGAAQGDRFSPALASAMEAGRNLAGRGPVTTGHLLSAMVDDPQCQAARALLSLGADRDAVARAVASVPIADTSDSPSEAVVEVHVAGRTLRVADPVLAARLASATTDEVVGALRRLVQETPGDPAA